MLDKKSLTFTSHLVPDAVGNKAYLQTPAKTPWRTIVVSDKATEILSSKLILNLNEPSKIEDTSWIKPQKFVGMWWEMHVGKANWDLASKKHGANTENVKSILTSRPALDLMVCWWRAGIKAGKIGLETGKKMFLIL